jgi:hypothetical protein
MKAKPPTRALTLALAVLVSSQVGCSDSGAAGDDHIDGGRSDAAGADLGGGGNSGDTGGQSGQGGSAGVNPGMDASTEPCGCPVTGHPVCGADGQNHPSACAAACSGVAIIDGCNCGRPDGSFCGCTTDLDIICGSDGQTWTNACLASQVGVTVASVGVCGSGARRGTLAAGSTCDKNHDLCASGLLCCDPAVGAGPLPMTAPTCTAIDATGRCPMAA